MTHSKLRLTTLRKDTTKGAGTTGHPWRANEEGSLAHTLPQKINPIWVRNLIVKGDKSIKSLKNMFMALEYVP